MDLESFASWMGFAERLLALKLRSLKESSAKRACNNSTVAAALRVPVSMLELSG